MRGMHIACAAALVVGGVIGGTPHAGSAQAAPVVVTTGAGWAAAWADPTVAGIVVASDVELACGQTPLRPLGSVPLTVTGDGGSGSITDACADGLPRLGTIVAAATTVTTWSDIALVGAEGGFVPVLRVNEAHLADVRITGRGQGETVAVGSGTTITDASVTGGAVALDVSGTPVTIEDVHISGTAQGVIALSGVEPLVIRRSRIETTGRTLVAEAPTIVERSALISELGGSSVNATALISDSTFVVTGSPAPGVFGTVLTAGPGSGEVVLEHATLIGPERTRALDVTSGVARLHASVLAGAEGCLPLGTVASDGDNVAVDGSCELDGPGDRVLADPGLEPFDPTAAVARPRADGPLVDAVADCRSDADQLGEPRPSGAACDIGAVELPVAVPPTTSTSSPAPSPGTAAPATPVAAAARFTG